MTVCLDHSHELSQKNYLDQIAKFYCFLFLSIYVTNGYTLSNDTSNKLDKTR